MTDSGIMNFLTDRVDQALSSVTEHQGKCDTDEEIDVDFRDRSVDTVSGIKRLVNN